MQVKPLLCDFHEEKLFLGQQNCCPRIQPSSSSLARVVQVMRQVIRQVIRQIIKQPNSD